MLSKALEVFGLGCRNLDSADCAESAAHPEREHAFICNLRVRHKALWCACMQLPMIPYLGPFSPTQASGCPQEHWFALRRVAGDWWDFNSLLLSPKPLSEFYLETYLATLRDQGYSIFCIRGSLPEQFPDPAGASEAPGSWFHSLRRQAFPLPFLSAQRGLIIACWA